MTLGLVQYELEPAHFAFTTGCMWDLQVRVNKTGYKWELQVPAKMYRIQK